MSRIKMPGGVLSHSCAPGFNPVFLQISVGSRAVMRFIRQWMGLVRAFAALG